MKNKNKFRICLVMNSRVYICTSGEAETPDADYVMPFIDSDDDNAYKLKFEDESISEVASSATANRTYANEAAAIADGLQNGQFFMFTATNAIGLVTNA